MLRDDEIESILFAGGGLTLSTGQRTQDTLIKFATAAAHRRARLVLKVESLFTTADLVRISGAGEGSVSFEWPA